MDRIVVPAVVLLSSVVGGCERPGARGESPPAPATQTYYIAADEVVWDYAPSGMDRITGLGAPGATRNGEVLCRS